MCHGSRRMGQYAAKLDGKEYTAAFIIFPPLTALSKDSHGYAEISTSSGEFHALNKTTALARDGQQSSISLEELPVSCLKE